MKTFWRELQVEFGEIHVFVGPDFVLTVRHSRTPDLAAVRHRMEEDPELLGRGRPQQRGA